MNPSTLERAAYLAAHRIMQADISNPQFACPGTRRSRAVDAIAGIIKGVMEAEKQEPEPCPLHDLSIRYGACSCAPMCPDSPDHEHHVAPIGSDEEWMPSKSPCYYCGEKQADLAGLIEARIR